jgi:hypothetical protein
MKKLAILFTALILFAGCKSYNYFPAPAGAHTYGNAGEVQATGAFGTSGFSASGGAAITDQLSVHGQYNSANGAFQGYHAKDGELGAGWSIASGAKHKLTFAAGYSWGNTYDLDSGEVVKDFEGRFSKPYFMLNFGSVGKSSGSGIKADFNAGLKFNYLMYDGHRNVTQGDANVREPFTAEQGFLEPYVAASFGGKCIRFTSGMGFAVKGLGQMGNGARVYPMQLYFGLNVILGRVRE